MLTRAKPPSCKVASSSAHMVCSMICRSPVNLLIVRPLGLASYHHMGAWMRRRTTCPCRVREASTEPEAHASETASSRIACRSERPE